MADIHDALNFQLSVKEIVEMLLAGKKITLPFNSKSELDKAMSNFGVEKSRKIKVHSELGFDIDNKIIRYDPRAIPCLEDMETFVNETPVTFYCVDPPPPKKYSVFKIED